MYFTDTPSAVMGTMNKDGESFPASVQVIGGLAKDCVHLYLDNDLNGPALAMLTLDRDAAIRLRNLLTSALGA